MKTTTFHVLSHIPLIGPFVKLLCDPMLSSTPAISDGIPKEIRAYMKAHPDIFITKRLAKKIMSGSK